MPIIAEVTVPTGAFALEDALSAVPSMYVEADEAAAHAPDSSMPCLWVSKGDFEAFDAALANDPTVERVHATADFEEERLYHVRWAAAVKEFLAEIIDHKGTIVEATALDGRWRFRIRFMTRDQFDKFHEYFEGREIGFRLEQLFTPRKPRQAHGPLTDEQYEALTTALKAGYFEVPRQATTEDVAAALDISHQAVSERIRRGSANLMRELLVGDPRTIEGPASDD